MRDFSDHPVPRHISHVPDEWLEALARLVAGW